MHILYCCDFVIYFQLVVLKGSMYEDFFRYSNEPVIKKAWNQHVLPYINDDPIYKVTIFGSQ